MNIPPSVTTRSFEQTRVIGRALGEVLRVGGLIMLRGGLGVGKTTFTQGIGEGMGVRGRVISPTFIVIRVHHSLPGGPDLIRTDAYRIRDLEDLETPGLGSSLADSVIAVEWGEGETEAMSEERPGIDVECATGGKAAYDSDTISLETMDDGGRRVEPRPHGTRWDEVLDRVLTHVHKIIAEDEAQILDEGEKADDAGVELVALVSGEQDRRRVLAVSRHFSHNRRCTR